MKSPSIERKVGEGRLKKEKGSLIGGTQFGRDKGSCFLRLWSERSGGLAEPRSLQGGGARLKSKNCRLRLPYVTPGEEKLFGTFKGG